ncbi:MAG: hypothetical protein GY703_23020 [Gammaproteobacteria bacterium]|nr:hypothetical protein [Gammaproteobacteria bacterium]
MTKSSLALVVRGIILLTALAMTACTAVKTNPVKTDQLRISYLPPENPAHKQVYELLKERQSLEKLKRFLSPFRLEWVLNISLTECGGEADAMYADDRIAICYEYIESLRQYMPSKTTPAGIEPVDTLVGPFVDTVLHEFAHALFDYLDIPVLGREEDAADQVAAYIYLQLDKAQARRLIMGTVYTYLAEAKDTAPPSMVDFANEHSTLEQRAFNLICMAYGADSELFGDLPALWGLPRERADVCEEEYELVQLAYQTLIGPHIDPELAENIFDQTWLPEKTSQILKTRR